MEKYMPRCETMMSYNDWADLDNRRRMAISDSIRRERYNRKKYYEFQRHVGLLMVAIGLLALFIACLKDFAIMQGVTSVVVIAGIYVTFTKHMLIHNEYYFECMDRLNNI